MEHSRFIDLERKEMIDEATLINFGVAATVWTVIAATVVLFMVNFNESTNVRKEKTDDSNIRITVRMDFHVYT
jgi:hypothetical protein